MIRNRNSLSLIEKYIFELNNYSLVLFLFINNSSGRMIGEREKEGGYLQDLAISLYIHFPTDDKIKTLLARYREN